ncbi:hypothetical protein ACRQEF_04280 [Actinotignum sp. GS-2025a]|uniref:hypothetical protein n=1 Tax=Actinotignum sp. GS-2025a TaxID=3427274 RepID=UPI003F476A43
MTKQRKRLKAQRDSAIRQEIISATSDMLGPAIYTRIKRQARLVAERYKLEGAETLIEVAFASELRRFSRALSGRIAAQARYEGATLQEIADALRYSSNSHVKRAWPNLDDIADTIGRLSENNPEENVEIAGWDVKLEYTRPTRHKES